MPERTPAVASAALRRRATASSWPSSTSAKEASGFFSRLLTSPLARSGWAGNAWSWMPRSSMNALIVLMVGWRSPWTTKMPVFSGGTTSAAGGGDRLCDVEDEDDDEDAGEDEVVVVTCVVTGAGFGDCIVGLVIVGAGADGVVTVTVTVAGAGGAGCGAGAGADIGVGVIIVIGAGLGVVISGEI